MSVLVAQIGARLHYGAAKAFEQAGLLDSLVTDLHATGGVLDALLPGMRRYKPGFAKAPVYHRNLDGLAYKAMLKFARKHETWMHDFAAERLARHVLEVLRERNPDTIYGFDTALLPIMAADPCREARTYVLEQCIAPRATQVEVFKRLRDATGEREFDNIILAAARQNAIEREEWAHADRIVCPSRFVCDALIEQGCDAAKIAVVPYGFSPRSPASERNVRTLSDTPVGLFVGGVSYRKGASDLLEIARTLKGKVKIKAIGPVQVSDDLRQSLEQHVDLKGAVSFDEVLKHYASADFLIHPSHIEGSASVVYEALSFGLPCFVTKATGSVVQSGNGGFEYDAGDVASFVEGIEAVTSSPDQYEQLSRQALALSEDYTIEKYAGRLVNALSEN